MGNRWWDCISKSSYACWWKYPIRELSEFEWDDKLLNWSWVYWYFRFDCLDEALSPVFAFFLVAVSASQSHASHSHFGAGGVFELDLGDSEIPLTPKQEREQKNLKGFILQEVKNKYFLKWKTILKKILCTIYADKSLDNETRD